MIAASEESGVHLANVVFESLREHVAELTQHNVLEVALENPQYAYLLDLRLLTMQQRESIVLGLSTLRMRVAERGEVHLDFLAHMEAVRNYVLTQGVQP